VASASANSDNFNHCKQYAVRGFQKTQHRQSPHLWSAGHPDDRSCATASATRRPAQFLRESDVIVRSGKSRNITRLEVVLMN
jgi:hypothetical protein